MAKPVRKVVVVQWLDHHSVGADSAWQDADAIDASPALVLSVGFKVKETKSTVVIAHTFDEGETLGAFVIVKKAIVSMKEIPV